MKIDVDPFQVSDDMYAKQVDCLVVEASTKVDNFMVVKATEDPNMHYDEKNESGIPKSWRGTNWFPQHVQTK